MSDTQQHWRNAYSRTTYEVTLPHGVLPLRIGAHDATLRAFLQQGHYHSFHIVTADNPLSQKTSNAENARQQARLEQLLRQKNLDYFAVRAIADNDDWPIENAYLILGLSLKEASQLARQFEQNAIVTGTEAAIPELFFLGANDDESI